MITTKRTTRRVLIASVCLVAVLGAGTATWALLDGGPDAASAETPHERRATAPVTKQTLTDQQVFAGTLGYGQPVGIPGVAQGTLTWLPTPGQVIHRDEPLYAVDERQVRAMHGSVPLWRSLEYGLRGADVAQLNTNLAGLGYSVAEDDVFGKRTLAAVRQWQEDRGRTVTGVLTADDVAFVDGDVRVDSVVGQLGQPAGGDVLQVTSTERVVTATVGQQDADRLSVGTEVRVLVNGTGDPITGSVVDAAPVPAEGDSAAKVAVTIALEQGDRELPTAASAQVTASGRTEKGVTTVPIAALVAGDRDGEYAVDVVHGSTTKRVPVEVGFVADGRAAVTGGVHEGDRVVVPS
ncbi:peptidoglycan-binding protein [Curtobacterium sp. MCSS17_008]|uniref:peptidoglycan-binding protein n=1 Tax=Curtobacterium sp. MCSS17_008 TaxID=2175647 RepID=UPI001C647123|nr:peptidoglycan-binding protein [Curtobacterium sp. MCSS17_008]